jgi:hypothetical protein
MMQGFKERKKSTKGSTMNGKEAVVLGHFVDTDNMEAF